MSEDTRIQGILRSAKWFLFAVTGNDQRRSLYAKGLARFRTARLRQRRLALRSLSPPSVVIPREAGFVACANGALGPTDRVVAEVQRRVADLADLRSGTTKPYLFDLSLADLEPSSGLAEFALREDVVACASDYLGSVPRLTGIAILRSPHVPGPPTGSQLFHCDHEDLRQVKVFVHCSPVSAENGPLTAVEARASARVKRAVGYRYGGSGFRLPDERVLPLVSDAEVTCFTGPEGAITLIDTSSCLHYGSRVDAGAQDRLVVQFQYLTVAAFDLLFEPRRRCPIVRASGSHSHLARLALGGEE